MILYELLTGVWPFMEETRVAMFQAHLTKPPPAIGPELGEPVPAALEAAFQKAMAKQASDRFSNAGEMLAAIQDVRLAKPAREPGPARIALFAVPVLLFALTGLIALWLVMR